MKTASLLALGVMSVDARRGNPKCSTPVQYEVTITNTWTDENHPNDFPANAQLSPTIGVSHSSDFGMWSSGFMATPGVKSIAETGSTADMETQISAGSRYVLSWDKLSGGFAPADKSVAETLPETLTLDVSEQYSRVSALHMLAASPDWFTGVSGVELCVDGKWADSLMVYSQPYDAGTDCGVSYASDNCVEPTQDTVHSITASRTTQGTDGPIFVKDDTVVYPVAKWEFSIVEGEGSGKPKPKPKNKPSPRGLRQ